MTAFASLRARVRPLGPGVSALLVCGLSVFITLFVLWLQPSSLLAGLLGMLRQPLLIVLNGLPILLLVAAFALLFRNVFFAGALVGLVASAASIGNRVKIQIRDEPFVPRDLGLLKEAADAAGSYDIRLPWGLIACLAGLTLLLVLLGLLFPTRPLSARRGRERATRLGGFAGLGALLVCLVSLVYSSAGLYNSFSVSNAYHLPTACNELGFPYFFCYHFSTYKLAEPEGFDRREAAAWEAETGAPSGAPAVQVLFVMNEAFSDITGADAFAFAGGDDPLRTFHALSAGENAVAGRIVVPYFAGGTADTEFDVATGMQTWSINPDSAALTAFRTVTRAQESLFALFGAAGYETSFLHPGDSWFYNRENVYRWFGADESVFLDGFDDPAYKGRWVADEAVARLLEARFAQTVAAGAVSFTYAVTIQNHMAYTYDKYGEGYVFPTVPLARPVSAGTQEALDVYVEGLRDADAMLAALTAYFADSAEPVLLVFFGDHLPYLGDDRLGYRELGLPAAGEAGDDPLAGHEAPFLIWCNDAAAAALDFPAAVEALDLPTDGRISASFLGAVVVELLGREGESPWFDFLNALRRELPVLQNGIYIGADGRRLEALDGEQAELLRQYLCRSHYRLRYGLY